MSYKVHTINFAVLMSFNKHTYSCNHDVNKDTKCFQQSKTLSVLLLSIFPLTIAKFQLLYNFKFLIRYGEGRARFHSARFWDSSVLFHVSVLHYFLFLIFYVEYTINYPLICEWTLEYLKFLAIMNKSSHLYKSFCG